MKCDWCEENEGTLTFANSSLDFAHGFSQKICKECYVKHNLKLARDCINVALDERDEFICCECEERLNDHQAVIEHVKSDGHHEFKSNKFPNLRLCVG